MLALNAASSPTRFSPLPPRAQPVPVRRAVASPLDAVATPQTAKAGQVLFQEGDPAAALFEVTKGVVRLCRMMPDGRRSITGFAFPGAILGLPIGEVFAYTAEAITGCELRRATRSAVGRLLESNADFARRMLAVMSDELSAAQDQMLLLGRKHAAERLASFLLWVARKNGRASCEASQLDLPMSRTDVADYLGLTTETVSREMTKLRQAGVVTLPTPQRIKILQPELLQQIAEEGEATALHSSRVTTARWPS
jgi:CRP/FNR family transcriptional regulator